LIGLLPKLHDLLKGGNEAGLPSKLHDLLKGEKEESTAGPWEKTLIQDIFGYLSVFRDGQKVKRK